MNSNARHPEHTITQKAEGSFIVRTKKDKTYLYLSEVDHTGELSREIKEHHLILDRIRYYGMQP